MIPAFEVAYRGATGKGYRPAEDAVTIIDPLEGAPLSLFLCM